MTKSASPTILVAALTYNRPAMLAALLQSLLKLERPAGWAVRFLIVDNDPEASARQTVEAAGEEFGGLLDYVVEPEPGIPFGRNRAMREAMERGASLQCFLDDDGYPDPTWLCELLACRERTGAAVVGGPVRLLPPPHPIGPWQRFLTRSVMARNALVEESRARAAAEGRAQFQTANWMADLDWVASNKLEFNTDLRFTGGSDFAFLRDLQTKGGTAAWCETAIVFDHWQPTRFSARYRFRRSMEQGRNVGRLCPQPALKLAIRQPVRMLAGVALMAIPLRGAASFALGLEMFAVAMGKLSTLWGAQSKLYARAPAGLNGTIGHNGQ